VREIFGLEGAGIHRGERLVIEAPQKTRPVRELYEDNFERVYAFIARRVYDREQAQTHADVFHQALQPAALRMAGIPFAAWLYRIAANAIAITQSKARARKEISKSIAIRDAILPAPLSRAIRRSRRSSIARGLFNLWDRLPADQRP